jgi:hypothetical protein
LFGGEQLETLEGTLDEFDHGLRLCSSLRFTPFDAS